MKFIKTIDGRYYNANSIENFYVDTSLEDDSEFFVEGESTNLFCTLAEFKTRSEAEKYLEELITRLETE